MKLYKTMATPTLMYGRYTWIITRKNESEIQSAETRFLRRVKTCTRRDLRRNEYAHHEVNLYAINEKIVQYREKWKQDITRWER